MSEPPPDPPNRGGRPRAADPGTTVTTWVRSADYDRLLRLAKARDQSISSLVRDLLKLRVK